MHRKGCARIRNETQRNGKEKPGGDKRWNSAGWYGKERELISVEKNRDGMAKKRSVKE